MRSLGLALVLLSPLPLAGCDVFEGGLETEGNVDEVGGDYLVVDAIRYGVTGDTQFEGYSSLADVQVGDPVEVDYEDRGGERVATDIDAAH